MTITLTYESTLSRVRVDASTVGVTGIAGATVVQVERSLDQVVWTSVRCGVDAPLVSGAATVYDYEFVSGVTNYYRTTYLKDVSFLAVGARAEGNNTTLNPALPATHAAGDLLLCYAGIHNSGTPNVPTGYTLLADMSSARLFGKIDSGSESSPSVSFSGGAAGPVDAQVAAFRNVNASVVNLVTQLNASAQNIAYPALDVTQTHALLLYLGWKVSNWSSVATLPGDGGTAFEIGEPTSFQSGIGLGLVWDYVIQTNPTDVVAGAFVVSSGPAAISRSAVLTLPPTTATQVNSITPTITTVWLKSITRPFLNRTFPCVPPAGDITRGSRTGIFEVINRGFPVAVTDVAQSRAFDLRLVTQTTTQWQELDLIVSAGDVMFLHTPLNYEVPSMYVIIGDVVEHRPLLQRRCNDDWRTFTLPLREVARPDSSICGSTVTWQSVINTYASWQATLNGETSWLDLLANVGTPSDILVP